MTSLALCLSAVLGWAKDFVLSGRTFLYLSSISCIENFLPGGSLLGDCDSNGLLSCARRFNSSTKASPFNLRRLLGFLPDLTLSQACASSWCKKSVIAPPSRDAGLIRIVRYC